MDRTVIQTLWVGDELGTLQVLSLQSFLANDCDVRLYSYRPVSGVPAGTTVCDASAIIPEREVFSYREGFGKGSYSAFSNLFRYQLLFDKGGWWVDTDVICLQPLRFDAEYVFATEHSSTHVPGVASCVVKSPAGAEYLRYCLEVCASRDPNRLSWGQIGPQLMDDAVWRFGLERFCTPVHYFNPVDYYDFNNFVHPGFDLTKLIGSYTVHLWHQMWKSQGSDPDLQWPRDSLVGMLKDRYLDTASDGG